MTTATKTIKMDNGNIITVKLTREVSDKVAYADGYNIKTGREKYERYEISMYHAQSGKTIKTSEVGQLWELSKSDMEAKKQGAVAKLGNAYLGEKTYAVVTKLIAAVDAEVGRSDEFVAFEQAEIERKRIGDENMRRMEDEQRQREKHPGWCNKCHSYCYGDCTANH